MPANQLRLLHLQHVNGGETLYNMTVKGRMVTEPVSKILNPAYWHIATYNVPYRLCDPAWVDFIVSGSENDLDYTDATKLPSGYVKETSTTLEGFFVKSGAMAKMNGLHLKALEQIYNAFYSKDFDTYSEIGTDVKKPLPDLAHVDELTEDITLGDLPDVPVGTNIEELKDNLQRYHYELRRDNQGGNYSEFVEEFGGTGETGFVDQPQLVDKYRSFTYPSRTVGHTNANIVGQYMKDYEFKHKLPKNGFRFNEHGLLLTVCALRPEIFYRKAAPLDTYRGQQHHFFQPLDDEVRLQLATDQWLEDATRDEVSLNQLAYEGEMLTGDIEEINAVEDRIPVSKNDYGTITDDDLWDLDNFQFSGGTDAQKLRRVAWTTGITTTSFKTNIAQRRGQKTLEKDSR
jgi:hypothetical protein